MELGVELELDKNGKNWLLTLRGTIFVNLDIWPRPWMS